MPPAVNLSGPSPSPSPPCFAFRLLLPFLYSLLSAVFCPSNRFTGTCRPLVLLVVLLLVVVLVLPLALPPVSLSGTLSSAALPPLDSAGKSRKKHPRRSARAYHRLLNQGGRGFGGVVGAQSIYMKGHRDFSICSERACLGSGTARDTKQLL